MSQVLFELNNVQHFEDGGYKDSNLNYSGNIYEYYNIVSAQFNQLKAKLFNLVEASFVDKAQREAIKGLIKDFSNKQFQNVIDDLEGWIERLGFKIQKSSHLAYPLESAARELLERHD